MNSPKKAVAEIKSDLYGMEKYVGTINGAPWWTNGHVMFKGKLAGKHKEQPLLQRVYDAAVSEAALSQLTVGKQEQLKRNGRESISVYHMLSGEVLRTLGNAVYIDYAKARNLTFHEGNVGQFYDQKRSSPYIVCKDEGGQIAGIIAPCVK